MMSAPTTNAIRSAGEQGHAETRRQRDHSVLRLSGTQIEQTARWHGPRQHIAEILIRQAIGEWSLRLDRGITFRCRSNREALDAYCEMELNEFQAINARQAWANWRTIPRSLNGRLPNRAVQVIDLCSGCGESTAVLGYYCAPGSKVWGLEFNSRFVAQARLRNYLCRDGGLADVRFHAQSVLETFRDDRGRVVPDRTIDLVNASGAIGCHFDSQGARTVAAEVARVLKPSGWALIDSGADSSLVRTFTHSGFELMASSRSSVFDRYRQLCLRRIQ